MNAAEKTEAVPGTMVAIGAIPIREKADGHEYVFQYPNPGIVRSVAWVLEKRLVMTAGQAGFDEVLTLFVEFSPNAPKRNHRFLVMPTQQEFSVPDGYKLRHAGTAVSSNTGRVAHVFEIEQLS